MYRKILVALDNTAADRSLLPHVAELAGFFHSHLVLLHVAEGFAARLYDELQLTESQEIREDRDYLERTAAELRGRGLNVSCLLAMGNPPEEILKTADREQCDLIAMTSHGHRWLADLFLGSTINEVRHRATMPVLLVRAAK
jgi:nucleotide-binding universal stress UspA family protein